MIIQDWRIDCCIDYYIVWKISSLGGASGSPNLRVLTSSESELQVARFKARELVLKILANIIENRCIINVSRAW